ncbi:hypothetical protein AUI06_06740 [archaeon 13_2_20CM_2_52_21]|nr:MAG: hypothetical protein AUI06_06740 [archaeon 13_2_20CM_2_52_21]
MARFKFIPSLNSTSISHPFFSWSLQFFWSNIKKRRFSTIPSQFSLLPIIGILVYNLTKEKGWAITIIAEVITLLAPAVAPGWGFSVAYFWQWNEGQSKVLETFLLTLSFYLGNRDELYGPGWFWD